MSKIIIVEARVPCIHCGKTAQVAVPSDGYFAWMRGTFIQDAMPEVPREKREILISGTHPECWKELFGG